MILPLNGIALQLDLPERLRLEAICRPVELVRDQLLEPLPGPQPEHPVYFLQGATASLWIEPGAGSRHVAVGLAGREGMVGCSHLWSSGHGQWVARVLTPGSASVTNVAQLHELMAHSPALVMAITQFLWRQTQEVVQLSARMLVGDIRMRLALWLHLMHHKTGQRHLRVTHEALAEMLGIRRVSVTLTAGQLQSEGVLALHRGALEIQDLPALTRIAGLHT